MRTCASRATSLAPMQHNEYDTGESESRNGKQRHAVGTQLRCGRLSISERDIAASIQRKVERGFEPRQGEGTRITVRKQLPFKTLT
jgi:hypothetical protein